MTSDSGWTAIRNKRLKPGIRSKEAGILIATLTQGVAGGHTVSTKMTTHLFRPFFILLALLTAGLTGCSSVPATEPVRPPVVVFASSNLEIPPTARVVIVAGNSLALTLPASNPENTGLTISIKNTADRVLLRAIASDRIEDSNQVTLQRKEAVTVVADGRGHWHIIGEVK